MSARKHIFTISVEGKSASISVIPEKIVAVDFGDSMLIRFDIGPIKKGLAYRVTLSRHLWEMWFGKDEKNEKT